MRQQWSLIRLNLQEWISDHHPGRKFIFTELGYPSQRGGAVKPWHYSASTQVDLEEQRRAYKAFRYVWQSDQNLGGVYFWNWWGLGGPHDTWYTLRGKPAIYEVRRFIRDRMSPPRDISIVPRAK